MRQRIICSVLALCRCALLCSCVGQSAQTDVPLADDATLYSQGLEMAGLLEEMVNSEQYLDLMSTAESVRAVLEPLEGQDFSRPESVYRVTFSQEVLASLASEGAVDLEEFSRPLRKFVLHRMQNSVLSMLNSRAGAETLAAASICTVSQTYEVENIPENAIFFYFYPDACPVMVSFHNGTASLQANAAFLLSGALEEGSAGALEELFQEFGEGVTVEELEIPEG